VRGKALCRRASTRAQRAIAEGARLSAHAKEERLRLMMLPMQRALRFLRYIIIRRTRHRFDATSDVAARCATRHVDAVEAMLT